MPANLQIAAFAVFVFLSFYLGLARELAGDWSFLLEVMS